MNLHKIRADARHMADDLREEIYSPMSQEELITVLICTLNIICDLAYELERRIGDE